MEIRSKIKFILEAMRVDDKGNLIFDEPDESHEIYVQHKNPQYGYHFKIQGAFKVGKELFLLGFHGENNQMSMLGFEVSASLRGKTGFVYPIKQQSDGYYKKALNLKVGKTYPIYCDISSGFWGALDGVKVDLQTALTLVNTYDKFKEIVKTPDGFLF